MDDVHAGGTNTNIAKDTISDLALDGGEGIAIRLARAEDWVRRLSAERQELEQKLGLAASQLETTEIELRQFRLSLKREQAVSAKLTRERDALRATRDPQTQEADERLNEIIALTRLVREQEVIAAEAIKEMDDRCEDAYDLLVQQMERRQVEVDRFNRRIIWLRAVLAEVLQATMPRSRATLGRGGNIGAIMSKLRQKGLFDGAQYLAAHSDVAEAGYNPLLHFVQHGIDEDRLDL